jgi:hypothetical protein
VVVDEVMNEVQGQQLGSHILRFDILLLFVAEDFMAQFA